jgi:predicted metal-dependent hydrolase
MNDTPVQITYHRQRSSTARIRDGQIFLRISSMVSRREQQEHIDHLLRQMQPKLARQVTKIKLSLRSVFHEGEVLLSTGIQYRIVIKKSSLAKYKIQKTGDVLYVLQPVGDAQFDFEAAEEVLWKFLEKDQLAVLQQRLDWLAEGWITERCRQVRLRRTLSRWGSCDKRQRVIMLSTKLLLVEQKLLDYVCIHELAHLKYADHSDLFWDLVSQKMPDWKVQRKKLRKYYE